MKLPNYLTVFFAVLAIVALLGLAGFVTYATVEESSPFRQTVDDIFHLDEILPLDIVFHDATDVSAPVQETEQSKSAAAAEHHLVFVGDSRTIGMRDAVMDSCIYIGAEGEGYDWFSSKGVNDLRQVLDADPVQKVIFNLGVNDPENISLYLTLYQELLTEYPKTSFYMMSVNPLDDNKGFNTTNAMIEDFNADLRESFPDHYLDTYSYLRNSGYETVDGLHYTENTYQQIHAFAVGSV
ncbi:MAG: hypothetical protein Q4B57_05590 [Eubacteriales bacterium]|nr:hypothetical protein [Eubacteriales bacterium]